MHRLTTIGLLAVHAMPTKHEHRRLRERTKKHEFSG